MSGMATDPQRSDPDELEAEAVAIVGRLVFAFSRFEFNLGLCLRNIVGGSNVDLVNPLIERLSFKNKLDALKEVVELRHASESAYVAEFREWYRTMDSLRSRRNSFVHGRWAVLEFADVVVNVAPGMPGAVPQRETRFTVSELRSELQELETAASKFYDLSRRQRSLY